MSFKDAVQADIDRVFLNLNEFADTHTVDGRQVSVVVNDDKQAKIKNGFLLGLIEADLIIYGKTTDFPKQKGIGKVVDYDGRTMVVAGWSTACGMTEIALNQNKQR